MKSLHESLINTDTNLGQQLLDNSNCTDDKTIHVYFKDLEARLLEHIAAADVVVGCVAWLTSDTILEALSKKKGVSIVVQKEDFLRPDLDAKDDWKTKLRSRYSSLPSTLTRFDEGLKDTVLHMMSCAGDLTIQAVRCVGNHNSDKSPVFPRAHHKFVVFCKMVWEEKSDEKGEYRWNYQPYEVWTGSFNFTQNATKSFENAIVIKNNRIVNAFYHEYAQIAALSEPLDWNSNWVAPEWRIGT